MPLRGLNLEGDSPMQMNTMTIVALIIIVACVAFLVLRRRG